MEESGYNTPFQDLMSMGGDNIVGLGCHGIFDTGVMCQGHQKGVAEVSVCLLIPRIGRVRTV